MLWLLLAAAFAFALPAATRATLLPDGGPLSVTLAGAAVALPVLLIWVVAAGARSMRLLRGEAARLRRDLEALRQAQARAPGTTRPPAARPPPPALPEDQPRLAFDAAPSDDTAPVEIATAIRALNFPENRDDAAGFAALRTALDHRDLARLIRASQDVLTLLSQDGIYMDDLTPDRARPEIWRRFAAGERGRTVAALGGIRDADTLALVATRMRADTIFRDATHHFLRTFDRSFAAFDQAATDADIAALSETRTARAFMLIGRVMGTFD